ncbi:hypothetical protein CUMW_039050 [Citrus unshiu]|nr:hypothetical protein CUMW_039050 [Citrus unshiu]
MLQVKKYRHESELSESETSTDPNPCGKNTKSSSSSSIQDTYPRGVWDLAKQTKSFFCYEFLPSA